MAWTGLTLTVEGRNALNRAQADGRLCFKSLVVGDGNPPANFGTQKELVHRLYELTDIKIDITEDGCALTADFPAVDYDYYFREIGVTVDTEDGEKLYVYDNCGDDAQYIVTTTGAERTQKRIRIYLTISDVEEVTVSMPSILYVDYDDYEREIVRLEDNIAAAKREAAEALADHIGNQLNPHAVTKAQIGLGNVDNTSDAYKPVSTAQQAALDGKLDKTGDAKDNTVTYTSADVADGGAAAWTSVAKLTTGEKVSSVLSKVSTMFKNIRYLYKMLGTTDISAIGGGTVTGAISKLNTDLGGKQNAATAINTSNISSQSVNYAVSAGTATKAAQDWAGRNIVDTYLLKSDVGVSYGTSLSAAKTIANDVNTEILALTIKVAGTYLINAQASFAGNKNGQRHLELKNTNANGAFGGGSVGASPSGQTSFQISSVSSANLPVNYVVRLYARQNCGASLNVSSAYISAIWLK